MKKVFLIVAMGLLFFSLVVGASCPAPFTADNTATIVGNGNIDNVAATSVASNLDANVLGDDVVATVEADKELFSEEDICRLTKGCWVDWECFPNGYRVDDKYCGVKRVRLINQSDAGESCDNSFECKSNFCFNGECVDAIKTVDEGVVRIDKSDLEELRGIVESAEESMEEDYDEEVSKGFFGSLIDLIKKMFGW